MTIVAPFVLGSDADLLARMTAQHLGERWGTPFIVDNKPGPSSGTDAVAKAPSDGNTFLLHATSFTMNSALGRRVNYDPLKTFAPFALIATGTLGFVVSANTPVQSLKNLVELARSKPGELSYASSGNGTPQHLAMELFKLAARVSITHIPYKDSTSATRDLASGHVNTMISPLHTALSTVSSGKAKVIAVFGDERNSALPDTPTMQEAGFPEFQAHRWFALFVPDATSPDIVQKINADINTMLGQADIKEMLSKQGLVPAGGTPDRLTEMKRTDFARWKRVVIEARIRPDY